MTEDNSCTQCSHSVDETAARRIRRLGWALVVIGPFLMVFIGAIAAIFITGFSFQAVPGETAHFTGTPQQQMLIYALFGVIIVFGLVATAGGIWQIITGRRNTIILAIVLVLIFILVAVCFATTDSFDKKNSNRGPIRVVGD